MTAKTEVLTTGEPGGPEAAKGSHRKQLSEGARAVRRLGW